MAEEQTFASVYATLNPAQKLAVDTIDGPVLVIAGPGTGKTHVLTARIANILKQTDAKPSNILALTFTEAAAATMRERLANLIGSDGYYVHISTFHAFCSQVIMNHPEYFTFDRESAPITEVEQLQMIETILRDTNVDSLKPLNAPIMNVKKIKDNISVLKREGVSPDEMDKLIELHHSELPAEKMTKVAAARSLKKQQQLRDEAVVYELYQKRLRAENRFDFEDMIVMVADAFRNNELLLLEYQENLHYFLVDEFQDTNTAQNEIVTLLASYWGEKANLFAVGDPHQSIFRFQGASVENVVSFINSYPGAKIITLDQGYRCPQEIYTAAHELVSAGPNLLEAVHGGGQAASLAAALNQPLLSVKDNTNALICKSYDSQQLELADIALQIRALIDSGVEPSEIAVLYTKNLHAADIAEQLDKQSIPYDVEGGSNALDSEPIRQLHQLFQLIAGCRTGQIDNGLLLEVLTFDWLALDRTTIFQLARYSSTQTESYYDVLRSSDQEKLNSACEALSSEHCEELRTFISNLESWSAMDANMSFPQWFESIITQSNFLSWIEAHASEHPEWLFALNTLFAYAKKLMSTQPSFKLLDFLRTLETMSKYKLGLETEDFNTIGSSVKLSTVFKAKGLEWKHVFIMYGIHTLWGGKNVRSNLPLPSGLLVTQPESVENTREHQDEDDRRLFYVALTRAQQVTSISFSRSFVQDGVDRITLPSQFIAQLEKSSALKIGHQAFDQQKQLAVLKTMVGPRVATFHDDRLEAFVRTLVQDFALSTTALDSYLRDPREFLFNTLLRIPRAKAAHQSFGTAMHKALQLVGTQLLHDGSVSQEAILSQFRTALTKEHLEADEYRRRAEKGEQVLETYLPFLLNQEPPNIWKIEQSIGYGEHTSYLGDIRLSGRLDRIDWIDQDRKLVRVVDYKTGTPKTLGTITAATKTELRKLSEREQALPTSIRGSLKRQLLFYRLLTQQDKNFLPTVEEGAFDFVEAALEGKHSFIVLALPQDDVDELANLIREVMEEIRSLKFLTVISNS